MTFAPSCRYVPVLTAGLLAALQMLPMLLAWKDRKHAEYYFKQTVIFSALFLANGSYFGDWFLVFPLIAVASSAAARCCARKVVTETLHPLLALTLLVPVAPHTYILTQEYRHASPEGVQLRMPLAGRVDIGQGGVSKRFNSHADTPGQRWAVDMARPLTISDLIAGLAGRAEAYSGFGADVMAPCDGLVAGVRDVMADQPIGVKCPTMPEGNFIILRCAETTPVVSLLLAHLKKGSTRVAVGDTVRAGEVVAQVGNTGNTTRPHLHIDALDMTGEVHPKLTAVPMWFDGRFLRAHDVINGTSL